MIIEEIKIIIVITMKDTYTHSSYIWEASNVQRAIGTDIHC